MIIAEINGKEVEMTDAEYNEYIIKNPRKRDYKELRLEEYGSIEQQMEFITENGLEAWQKKVAEIKIKHPKIGE